MNSEVATQAVPDCHATAKHAWMPAIPADEENDVSQGHRNHPLRTTERLVNATLVAASLSAGAIGLHLSETNKGWGATAPAQAANTVADAGQVGQPQTTVDASGLPVDMIASQSSVAAGPGAAAAGFTAPSSGAN
jgi:hypothetical protein